MQETQIKFKKEKVSWTKGSTVKFWSSQINFWWLQVSVFKVKLYKVQRIPVDLSTEETFYVFNHLLMSRTCFSFTETILNITANWFWFHVMTRKRTTSPPDAQCAQSLQYDAEQRAPVCVTFTQSLLGVDEMAARSLSCSMTRLLSPPRITDNVRRSHMCFPWKVHQRFASVSFLKTTRAEAQLPRPSTWNRPRLEHEG